MTLAELNLKHARACVDAQNSGGYRGVPPETGPLWTDEAYAEMARKIADPDGEAYARLPPLPCSGPIDVEGGLDIGQGIYTLTPEQRLAAAATVDPPDDPDWTDE